MSRGNTLASSQPLAQQRQAQTNHIRIATIEAFHAAPTATFKGKAASTLQWLPAGDIGLDLRITEGGEQHTGGHADPLRRDA